MNRDSFSESLSERPKPFQCWPQNGISRRVVQNHVSGRVPLGRCGWNSLPKLAVVLPCLVQFCAASLVRERGPEFQNWGRERLQTLAVNCSRIVSSVHLPEYRFDCSDEHASPLRVQQREPFRVRTLFVCNSPLLRFHLLSCEKTGALFAASASHYFPKEPRQEDQDSDSKPEICREQVPGRNMRRVKHLAVAGLIGAVIGLACSRSCVKMLDRWRPGWWRK